MLGLKSVLLGTTHWCDQWYSAESVNLLLKDKNVVLTLNDPQSGGLTREIKELGSLNNYKLYCQWSDNFMCDTVCNIPIHPYNTLSISFWIYYLRSW